MLLLSSSRAAVQTGGGREQGSGGGDGDGGGEVRQLSCIQCITDQAVYCCSCCVCPYVMFNNDS